MRALCSLDGAAAQQFAAQYGIPHVSDSIGDLLDRGDILAVIISAALGARMFVTPIVRWGTNRDCAVRNAQYGMRNRVKGVIPIPHSAWRIR